MKREIYIKLIKLVIAFLGVFILFEFGKLIYTLLDDQPTVSHSSLPEYKRLFTKDAQGKLELIATTKSRNSLPTSSYVYDNQFNIFVLKEILFNKSDLKNIMTYQNTSDINSTAVYSELPSAGFTMSRKSGKSVAVSTVRLNFSGDSIKAIEKNDSLYCYYIRFKTFSINYNSDPYDIIAKGDKSNIPASIAFIKKDKFLYIIIMSIAEPGQEMQPNLLDNIINK